MYSTCGAHIPYIHIMFLIKDMHILELNSFLCTTVKWSDNFIEINFYPTVHIVYTFSYALNRLQVRLEGNNITNTCNFECGKILFSTGSLNHGFNFWMQKSIPYHWWLESHTTCKACVTNKTLILSYCFLHILLYMCILIRL